MPAADASLGQLEGVDSSHWQGTIHPVVGRDVWDIRWWAHKATEGTSYVDPTFRKAQDDLRNAGIRYRIWYHFPRGDRSIEAQVDHFLRTIGPLEVGEAAKLDDESAESLGYPLTVKQAALWHRLVEEATGRPTVEYTGAFVKHSTDVFYHWDAAEIRNSTIAGAGERPNILASYNPWSKVTTRGKPVHVWQWTSTAVLSGICTGGIGRIDRDLVLDPHAYDLACGYADAPAPEPPPVIITLPEEDDMSAARIVTLKGYANAYLVGAGPVTYLTGELFASLTADGVKTVEVEPTDLALDAWGIERADLVKL